MKCKKKGVEVSNPVEVPTPNGAIRVKGIHKECGGNVSVIKSKKPTPLPLGSISKEEIDRRVQQDTETFINVNKPKIKSPPQSEKVDDAPLQTLPSQSPPSSFRKDAEGVWSAFVVITVALALVTTGNIWALSALGFLIFRLEAFSKGIILVAEAIGAPFIALSSWANRRGKVKELKVERQELELRKAELDIREKGLTEELKSFAEIRELARKEIEKLTLELKADDIRSMYQKELQNRNVFEKELMGDFAEVMKVLSPLLDGFPHLLRVIEREKERTPEQGS